MNTQAISNKAMRYESHQRNFTILKLEMKVVNDQLHVQISSPLLTSNNYQLQLKQDTLKLKIVHPSYHKDEISLPLECELFLPKHGYKKIVNENFSKGKITLVLNKKAESSTHYQVNKYSA